MNEKEQRYTRLNKEYDDLNGKINRLNDFINRIDFEEIVNDEKERGLMIDQYIDMCRYRANLKARIRILRDQIENDKIVKDWSQYKKTDSAYIGVDVSDEGDHSACSQVCGDGIATNEAHHCGLDAIRLVAYGDNLDQLIGARVRLFHAPGHKCEECPYRVKSDGSACTYHKIELISGHFICLTPTPNTTTE